MHVPPCSATSKLAVLSPGLYSKWTPRTVAVRYGEGLTKRSIPEAVVLTSIAIPMLAAEFKQKEDGFRKVIADVVGVTSAQVIVDRISDAVRVHLSIQSKDDGEAAKICGALTLDAINIKLPGQGLPKATLLEKPSLEHPGYCVLDFLTSTARIPMEVALGLVPHFVQNGITSRQKIFTMTDDDLKACGVVKEKQRQQIMVWIENGDCAPKSDYTNAVSATALEPNDAYRNMKKAVSAIQARSTVGAYDETKVGHDYVGSYTFPGTKKMCMAEICCSTAFG